MGMTTIALLGMMCAPGQAPADMTTWNTPTMNIPIDYNPGKRGEIKELLLFVSADQGQTWQQHAVAVPDRDTHFTYNAPADGTYWFNMVVVEKSGRREPADVFKAAPALKVLFDTKKPAVSIASAQRNGESVTVAWKVTEKNPDWSKFKLEYSTNGNVWTPVGTRPEADGSATFKAAGSGTLNVRVMLTDLAGHTGEMSTPVAGTAAVATSKPEEKPLVLTTGGEMAIPPTIGSAVGDRAKDSRLPSEPKGTDTPPSPGASGLALPPAPGTAGAPVIDPLPPPPMPGVVPPVTEPVGVSTSTSNLPVAQVINVTTFKMAYEVEDRGASGVGKAEVYVTRDEGKTWKLHTTIEKPESPLVIDLTKGGNDKVEGMYGFRVILQSGAGLGREAPKGGEAPDIRVDVDVTGPSIVIYEPVPDKTQKDTMILQWKAIDAHMATDPITLEWADSPKGPWFPVAAKEGIGASEPKRLPNTSSHHWKLPASFPSHKVYLKATARDTAGNVSEVVSDRPILVDLNKPAAIKLNIVGGK